MRPEIIQHVIAYGKNSGARTRSGKYRSSLQPADPSNTLPACGTSRPELRQRVIIPTVTRDPDRTQILAFMSRLLIRYRYNRVEKFNMKKELWEKAIYSFLLCALIFAAMIKSLRVRPPAGYV